MNLISEGSPEWFTFLQLIPHIVEDATIMWDFDGVIADTEPIQAASYRALLKERGYELADDFFEDLIGKTETKIWETLIARGAPVLEEEVPSFTFRRGELVLDMCKKYLTPNWFVHDLVHFFGKYSYDQVIVSNGIPEHILVLLEMWGLGDMIRFPSKEERGTGKAQLMKHLTSRGKTVSLEDNLGYLEAATDLGAYPLAVKHSMNFKVDFGSEVTTFVA